MAEFANFLNLVTAEAYGRLASKIQRIPANPLPGTAHRVYVYASRRDYFRERYSGRANWSAMPY